MPYTPIEVSEKMNKMPALTFPTLHEPLTSPVNGMMAKVPIAQISEMNGANR